MRMANILLSFLFSSTVAQAAWVLPVQNLTCTGDTNVWGQNQACECPESSIYNEKLGKCLIGERYPIMISGSLRTKDAQDKGAFFDTQVGQFQLVVKKSELSRLETVHNRYFEVEGEFVLLDNKAVILVDHLRRLE